MPALTKEHREAISRGQIARHRRQREQADAFAVTKKRCTQCGKWRRVPDEYPMRRRRLKSGEVRTYPAGECKICSRERAERWKKKYIEEHGYEAWLEKMKEYNRGRDPDRKRRYNREYSRLRRIEEGVVQRGPWKKYQKEPGRAVERGLITNIPFKQWWESLDPTTRVELQREDAMRRAVTRALEGVNTEIGFLDKVAVAVGDPGLIERLAPGV